MPRSAARRVVELVHIREEFSAVWPGMKEEAGEFGVKMNEMPKVVASSTLMDPEWENTSVISGDDLPAVVGKLKAQYDGDILVAGSARLANALREQDLVDEYRLMVHPVVLGGGKRLFEGGTPTDLELVESRQAGPDVLLLTLRPARAETTEN